MAIIVQEKEVKPGYKQTEAGVIPEDWKSKTFSEVMTGFTSGATPSRKHPDFYKGNIRWITSGELNYSVIMDTVEKISGEAVSRNNLKLLPKGTFLIAITGMEAEGTRGSCGIVGAEATTNQHCMALFPTQDLSTPYLFHYYVYKGKSLALQYCQGTKQQDYTSKIVKTLPILLPPLDEQQAIATVLSDVDALIASLDQLIAKKRDIKQATMQQLLTGRIRLPEFNRSHKSTYKQTEIGLIPEDWNIRSVEEIADVTTGNKDTQDKTDAGAYPFFVRSQVVERINSYSYDGEAVLTAGDGVGVGKVFHYVNGKFDFHQRVYMVYNFRNYDGFFFYLYFSNHFYKEATKYNAKNSVDSVRREMVTRMKVPQPSLSEQQAIATILSDMDAEISALEQRREKTRVLKQAMMQELLTGKTRLLHEYYRSEGTSHPESGDPALQETGVQVSGELGRTLEQSQYRAESTADPLSQAAGL